MIRVAWLSVCLLCIACAVSGKDQQARRRDASTASAADGATPLRKGVAYMQGVYSCCEQGIGRGCCEERDQTCLPFGGVYGHCVPEGSELDGKATCGFCCDGLTRADAVLTVSPSSTYPDGCDYDHAPGPGLFYCTRCGDGLCGSRENHCNCKADCPVDAAVPAR